MPLIAVPLPILLMSNNPLSPLRATIHKNTAYSTTIHIHIHTDIHTHSFYDILLYYLVFYIILLWIFCIYIYGINTRRHGTPNELLELGRVTPGTYCTRQFDECYRKNCRLQSPNYPGMYPRNVTCYWTIRQKSVPTCKHAMIAISQENSHKSLVKR